MLEQHFVCFICKLTHIWKTDEAETVRVSKSYPAGTES